MLDYSKVDPVVSGAPYDVTSVNGASPSALDEFAGEVVEIVVASYGQVVEIRGCSRVVDDRVIVHEKDENGTGSDVRVWQVSGDGGRFVALQSPWGV